MAPLVSSLLKVKREFNEALTKEDLEDTPAAFRAYTKLAIDNIGIVTLLGDYTEIGKNHQRKCFKKTSRLPGHEHVDVYIYYWDARDGPDFNGWWFGASVGGSKVWSRALSHGNSPPITGWSVPFDAAPQRDLLLVEPLSEISAPPTLATLGISAHPGPKKTLPRRSHVPRIAESRAHRASERVATLELEAQEIVEWARGLRASKGDVEEGAVDESLESLRGQLELVGEMQQSLSGEIQLASGEDSVETVNVLAELVARLRASEEVLDEEMGEVRAAAGRLKFKAQAKARQVVLTSAKLERETLDRDRFQEALPEVTECVAAAEVVVGAAERRGKPILENDDVPSEAQFEQVEQAVEKASTALEDAEHLLAVHGRRCGSFAQEAREEAKIALEDFQEQVADFGKRLQPLRHIREEHRRRVDGRRLSLEVCVALDTAEAFVEKAAALSGADSSEDPLQDNTSVVSSSLTSADAQVVSAKRQIEGLGAAGGERLLARCQQLQERAAELRKSLHTREQRKAMSLNEKETESKVKATEDAVAELFTLASSGAEGLRHVAKCEAAAEDAAARIKGSLELARRRLAEALEAPKEVASSGLVEALEELCSRMDSAASRLERFRIDVARRRTTLSVADIVSAIEQAEARQWTFQEALKPLLDADAAEQANTAAFKKKRKQVVQAGEAAEKACAEARQLLQERQRLVFDDQEICELSRIQSRLNEAQHGVKGLHNEVAALGTLLDFRKTLQEEESKLLLAEKKVQELELLATPLGNKEFTVAHIQKVDAAATEAQALLATRMQGLEGLLAGGTVAQVKAAIGKLVVRATKEKSKIESVRSSIKTRRDEVVGDKSVKEAKAKVAALREIQLKLEAVEKPFLKGDEVKPAVAKEALAESDALLAQAQPLLKETRRFLASKTLEARRFAAASAASVGEKLVVLTDRASELSEKFAGFRVETDDRKHIYKLDGGASKRRRVS